jgi:hypothetical protein
MWKLWTSPAPPPPPVASNICIFGFLYVKHLHSAWEGDSTSLHERWVRVTARLYVCVQIFQQAAISSSILSSPHPRFNYF